MLLPTTALLLAACATLARVYVGLGFVRPVVAALLLSLLVSWGSRRLGFGPIGTLLLTVGAWTMFAGVAFASDTLAAGLVPTGATLEELRRLWHLGLEHMRIRPAPVFPEPSLLLITTAGVWAVSHTVEGLVFWFRAPARAIVLALVLWVVPLSMAPITLQAWPWALPFLAAALALMLSLSSSDLTRWGRLVAAEGHTRRTPPLLRSGALIACGAMVAGALLATALPGFGAPAWHGARGSGGTTLTANPIVDIRTRLVTSNPAPLLHVTSPRPLYLRVTPLDVYSAEREEWTNSGISAGAANNPLPTEVPISSAELVPVELTAVGLDQPVLIPAPYQPQVVIPPEGTRFRYDRRLSTLTADPDHGLRQGDSYSVVAAVPTPEPDVLRAIDVRRADVPEQLVALPEDVPAAVAEQARAIVEAAGATTAFDQALAIQDELRTWTYSLTPPPGHSSTAMASFLESRTGYCEQFAGTMAVMLRSLGIPARVAVGFTPGTPLGRAEGAEAEGAGAAQLVTYEITQANAHAWVEVLFPGAGWIAFEPTPRADGNVLVPSATNLAPHDTAGEQLAQQLLLRESREDEDALLAPGAFLSDDEDEELAGLPGGLRNGGNAQGGRAVASVLLALLGGIVAVVVAGIVLLTFGVPRVRRPEQAPAGRVLAAQAAVELLGRGLGLRPGVAETDREYLLRLAGQSSAQNGAAPAAEELAAAVARARWSPRVEEVHAVQAESAAAALAAALMDDRSRTARMLTAVRGRADLLWDRLRRWTRTRRGSAQAVR